MRRTIGPKVGRLAAFMGQPLLPWLREAFEVALELDSDGSLFYREVYVSVPRQCAKTAGTLKMALLRTLITPSARVWYTAQTGAAAREHWLQELGTPAERLLGSMVTVKRGAGDTRLIVPSTDAQCRPMPPTADYLHGKQSDLVIVDEPWAFSEQEGAALLQAIQPTFNTRTGKGLSTQTWYISTKGDASSTWYHGKLAEAIAAMGTPGTRKCVIDYGIPPGADPTDLDMVIAHHPGVQGGLITPAAVYDAADSMEPNEFARAYGNVESATRVSILSHDTLDAATTDAPLDPGAISLGVAVSSDQSETAIVAVGTIDGTPAIEVIACRPGTTWVADMLQTLTAKHDVCSVAIDAHGPGLRLAEQLANIHLPGAGAVRVITTEDVVTGTEILMTGIQAEPSPQVVLRQNQLLEDEIAGAVLRGIGDRGRILSRSRSTVPIPRLEAAVLALREFDRPREQTPKPVVWSPA